uniref:Uncharacterized protein n=1 Tax=Arundo donax TaxID=35708 RepID=A0A0A9AKF1_ARUDO
MERSLSGPANARGRASSAT